VNDTIEATSLGTYDKVCCPINRHPVDDIFDDVNDLGVLTRRYGRLLHQGFEHLRDGYDRESLVDDAFPHLVVSSLIIRIDPASKFGTDLSESYLNTFCQPQYTSPIQAV
jgi:hypothetical protein